MTSRCASQRSTSPRFQPIVRSRNRCFFGNRPRRVSADSAQRGRRVSRATSRALRSSPQGSGCSLTHWGRVTLSVGVMPAPGVVLDPEISLLMAYVAHDVWFRPFRDELSRHGR